MALLIDNELLEEKITESGYKKTFLVDKLGISRTSFDNKTKGISPFRKSEIYVLCSLLNINNEDATKIFYPKS